MHPSDLQRNRDSLQGFITKPARTPLIPFSRRGHTGQITKRPLPAELARGTFPIWGSLTLRPAPPLSPAPPNREGSVQTRRPTRSYREAADRPGPPPMEEIRCADGTPR